MPGSFFSKCESEGIFINGELTCLSNPKIIKKNQNWKFSNKLLYKDRNECNYCDEKNSECIQNSFGEYKCECKNGFYKSSGKCFGKYLIQVKKVSLFYKLIKFKI